MTVQEPGRLVAPLRHKIQHGLGVTGDSILTEVIRHIKPWGSCQLGLRSCD